MEHLTSLVLCCFVLVFFNQGETLKCRPSNQQVDSQFVKVLKTCKKRYAGLNMDDNDFGSSDSSSSDSDSSSSEEEDYHKHFFYKKDDRSSYNRTANNQRYKIYESNSDTSNYLNDRSSNGNLRDSQNMDVNRRTNDRDSGNSRDSHSMIMKDDYNSDTLNNGDMSTNNNTRREQTCIVQCFFNELNAVDEKGFPERDMVIPLMSRNIQEGELKDFVKKSIMECFRYLELNKREKCEFSRNLLSCLADKGKQNCEDWV